MITIYQKYLGRILTIITMGLILGLTSACQILPSREKTSSSPTNPPSQSLTISPDPTLPPATQTISPAVTPEGTDTAIIHPPKIPSESNQPLENRIVYVSQQNGYKQLYLVNEDGSNPVQITDGESFNTEPTWSHDGTRIAFLKSWDENPAGNLLTQVFLIDPNGVDEINLTTSLHKDASSLAWAPDDQTLAFDAGNLNGDPTFPGKNIYLVDINTQDLRQITAYSPGSVGCRSANWSPDGRYLVFVCRGLMAAELVVNNQDGSDSFGIEFLGQIDKSLWLPSSKSIAYTWGRECFLGTLEAEYMLQKGESDFIRNPCLEDQLEDFEQEMIDFYAVLWSPTVDTRFVLSSPDRIQFIDLELTEILEFEGNYEEVEGQISWGPNEERIVFTFHDGNDFELAIIDLNTEEITQITENEVDDLMPAWQPSLTN